MTFVEVLQAKFRDQRVGLEDIILSGQVADLAEYKFYAGQIKGLALAERELLDLLIRTRTDGDDD